MSKTVRTARLARAGLAAMLCAAMGAASAGDAATLTMAAASVTLTDLPERAGHPVAAIDLTAPQADLWERIRMGFAMPDLDSDLVMQHQARYLSQPAYLRRMTERSRMYLFHIVEEIERRGMPTELALLPMVESAFNPQALSHAKASGLWQFIPSTGKIYDLEQNWWVDERRDIVASTSAALDYLQSIYELHGDWHLALASYNWGEGAVARAIGRNAARGEPTDYANLSMPAETRNYVPKLQALKNIVARPQLFGVELDPIPNRPYFVTVDKPAHIDVALAAKLAEMPLAQFLALNPGFKRPVIPAYADASIKLPADRAEVFQRNIAGYEAPLSKWRTYTYQNGDTLAKVASRFDTTVAELQRANSLHPRARIRPGHTLLVPARHEANAGALAEEVNPPTEILRARPAGRYVVKTITKRNAQGKLVKVKVRVPAKAATKAKTQRSVAAPQAKPRAAAKSASRSSAKSGAPKRSNGKVAERRAGARS